MPPASVLVLRFSAVGDILLASPAIEALHRAWPETKILYAVKAEFADLVRQDPFVSDVVAIGKGESAFSLAKRLAALKPGAILDLHSNNRSRWLRMLLPRGIPRVTWTKRPWTDNVPVRLALRPYSAQMHIAARYHAAVERLVGRTLPRGTLRYAVAANDAAAADRALVEAGVDLARPILGMSPGANWETKRWPIERYADLARRARESGMQVVVTGSPAESPLGDAIPGATNLCGKVSLAGLGGVIQRCTAFVANDSGPMHMARALGVPTLAFFGTTDPKQFVFDGHAVLFAATECAPCHFYGRRKCPKGHFRCMLDLTPDMAWSALTPLVRRGGRALPVIG